MALLAAIALGVAAAGAAATAAPASGADLKGAAAIIAETQKALLAAATVEKAAPSKGAEARQQLEAEVKTFVETRAAMPVEKQAATRDRDQDWYSDPRPGFAKNLIDLGRLLNRPDWTQAGVAACQELIAKAVRRTPSRHRDGVGYGTMTALNGLMVAQTFAETKTIVAALLAAESRRADDVLTPAETLLRQELARALMPLLMTTPGSGYSEVVY